MNPYNIIFHHTATVLIYCPFVISGENDSLVPTSVHPRWAFITAHWNPDVTSESIVIWQSYCGQEEGDRVKVVSVEPLLCTVHWCFHKMLILFLRDQDFMEETGWKSHWLTYDPEKEDSQTLAACKQRGNQACTPSSVTSRKSPIR